MPDRKNIFAIGRQGHHGDENQLTEMLAFLWQERPDVLTMWMESLSPELAAVSPLEVETQFIFDNRRPDMLISKPGEAAIVVESKLGSGPGLDQLEDYAAYLASERSEPMRALVFLTQRPEPWPVRVREAAGDKVWLLQARWQDMTPALTSSNDALTQDFLRLLHQEGLVMPTALREDDFDAWTRGHGVLERLREFLNEAKPGLVALVPNYKKSGPISTTPGYVYRLHSFEQVSFGIGFSPGDPTRPSVINTIALNEMLAPEQRAKAAQRALAHPSGECDYVWWGEWPTRSRQTADLLTAEDFRDQVDDAIAFAKESLHAFQRIGYLPNPL